MNDKYLLLLAFDSLLLDLDDDYEGVPEETVRLLKSKIYESYGFKVTSSKEDLKRINELLIQDVKNYRDKLLNDL